MLLIILLVVLFLAVLPRWPYSANWGYSLVSAVGAVLVILLLLAVLGVIDISGMRFPVHVHHLR